MDEPLPFGSWVRRRRKALDLTQAALAERVACVLVTIKKIEQDLRRPSQLLAERLATALELSGADREAFLRAARSVLAAEQLGPPPAPALRIAGPASALVSAGTLTFLFTDIVGSTRLWERDPQAMAQALARHDGLLRASIAANGGSVVKSNSDGVVAAFSRGSEALSGALAAQRALLAEPWALVDELRVRMALHSGEAEWRDGDYFGATLNTVARLLTLADGGHILVSAATAELVRSHLPPDVTLRDVGLHQLEGLERPEQVFQVLAPGLSAELPLPVVAARRRSNLPAQLTSFIGRERERHMARELLCHADLRLLTFTGPGGVGKTRLALQVAAASLDDFADGVYFVDLAPVSDPTLIASTIAVTLGVQEAGDQPLVERLKASLRSKQLLLVLDNFEQLVVGAPTIAELLTAAPHIKFLITSRMVLSLYGEHELIVPPLATPELAHLPDLERLSQYEAIQLFLQRARAARADFTITTINAAAVAEICARLDGLPLAIELAAVRSKLFTPSSLLIRLSSRLQLLTGGARTLPIRQQTLRNTIDWSYHLLEPAEQRLFASLAVFVGGCTLAAAEAVCRPQVEGKLEVLDGLRSLVDKSLLRHDEGPDGQPRFVMLETLREYAFEKLATTGTLETLRYAHAAYYLALAKQAEPAFFEGKVDQWLGRLKADHDNIRAILVWSQSATRDEVREMGAWLASALAWFWSLAGSGSWSEMRDWFERLLETTVARDVPALRARALYAVGWICDCQGDYLAAQALFEESASIFRELNDQPSLGAALVWLWEATMFRGNYDAAQVAARESLQIGKQLGNTFLLAWSHHNLGWIANDLGDSASARTHFEQSRNIHQAREDRMGLAIAMLHLGMVGWREGQYDEARAHLEVSLITLRKLDLWGTALGLYVLAGVMRDMGHHQQAVALYRESIAIWEEQGNSAYLACCLEGLAQVAAVSRQSEYAAQFWGAAERLFETSSAAPRPPVEHHAYVRAIETVRKQVGVSHFVQLWTEGRALTSVQIRSMLDGWIIPLVEKEYRAVALPIRQHTADTLHSHFGLTERETAILRLVAQGLTDAQVAERLVISPRTVQGHLRSIYSKLDVTSRTAATRFAVDHGLIE